MRHTIRFGNGNWQGWGDIRFPNLPTQFSQGYTDCDGIGNELHAVVTDFSTQNIWHTIRFANGAWTPWGRATAVIPPPPHTPLSWAFGCAGVGRDLHIVG